MRKIKNGVNILGGFVALMGFFLPFDGARSLFHILENTPLPYFSPLLVLAAVLAMVLYGMEWTEGALLLSLALLLSWVFLLCLLLRIYSPLGLVKYLSLSAGVLPLGLVALAVWPVRSGE